MLNIKDIAEGHIKELFNSEQELSESRLKICYSCPLYSSQLGGICNNKLWYDPISGDVSTYKKDNYIRGCGCRLLAKTRLPNALCPASKW